VTRYKIAQIERESQIGTRKLKSGICREKTNRKKSIYPSCARRYGPSSDRPFLLRLTARCKLLNTNGIFRKVRLARIDCDQTKEGNAIDQIASERQFQVRDLLNAIRELINKIQVFPLFINLTSGKNKRKNRRGGRKFPHKGIHSYHVVNEQTWNTNEDGK
jgi:hypothetical protein